MEREPRTEDQKSPERSEHLDGRRRQVTILRNYVDVLRKERDWLEAKLLNEHIHQVTAGGLQGRTLEELREETQREYTALLRKELQPTLEYYELIDEVIIEEIPLEQEKEPNFKYPKTMPVEKATTCGYCSGFNNTLHTGMYGMGCSDL